jgi:Kef-type K+ transport system membrane component KefB
MSGVAAAALSYGLTSWWIRHRPERPTSNMAVLMMLIGSAWVGEVSGLTSLLGALWGGVLVSRLCPRESQDARLLGMVSDVFLPLYFISVGMRVSAGSLINGAAWLLAGVLLVAALLSKLACGFGVTASDSSSGIDRWTVVYGLIPRGLPGLVFASTALNAGVINDQQFSALVIMVTVTTVLGLMLLEARLLQSRDRAATAKPPEALA